MIGTVRRNPRIVLLALTAAVVVATAVALSPGIGAGQTPGTDPPVDQVTPAADPPAALGTGHKGHDDGVQSAALSNTTISSAGPLNNIFLSNQGNCQVDHTGDSAHEFFGDVPGACATLIATGGILYGPSQIPAGGSAAPRTTFTEVSQSAVTGTGTAADPFKVITVMNAGLTLQLTQIDSYVVGLELYRTDVIVSNINPTGGPVSFVLYRAGDCFLQNSDDGFGDLLPNGEVGCRASDDGGATPGNRIERWIPLTPGSSAFEENFDVVWAWIGTQAPFPNTCVCTTYLDNGAGLSWSGAVNTGTPAQFSHNTLFAPNIPVALRFTG